MSKEWVFRKEVIIRNRRIIFEKREATGMGRFGGGWNWKLGIQVGPPSVIISLVVMTISIRKV